MEKLPKQFELRKTKFEPRPRCVCGDIKINHESEKKDIIFKYEMMLKDTQIELQNYKYILLKNNITT